MKSLTIAIALVGTMATASAFAQSNASTATTQQAAPTTQLAANSVTPAAQVGQWVSPDSQANTGKTRAQVYQELVHAEKDGQLDYLNSTLYAH